MVLVVLGHRGANVTLDRVECDSGRALTTHRTAQPKPTVEDIDRFRLSPSTHLRFGFPNADTARLLGVGPRP